MKSLASFHKRSDLGFVALEKLRAKILEGFLFVFTMNGVLLQKHRIGRQKTSRLKQQDGIDLCEWCALIRSKSELFSRP